MNTPPAHVDNQNQQVSDQDLQDMVAANDTGARSPVGSVGLFLTCVAIAWSLFQLWTASPLQFMAGNFIPILNDTEKRAIHLAFAVFLAFMAYPAFKKSPRDRIPFLDWMLALVAAFCASYLCTFSDALATRPGRPTDLDLIVSGVGIVTLLEAARRALGMAMCIVAGVFLFYVFFGSSEFLPDVIRWKGASYNRAMSHLWLTTEGVFGIALGVSASFVFLFVLFGAMLDKGGAGNYFINIAFSLLGHLRGGPAKAAVVGSAMTGLISGSSIANVVTTGTFTIPLMRRVGFTREQAGSVEVASSVNGQIMPPVMGAAAFLMVEYVGISYTDVIKHALLPATISYIALLYIVHLEALKKSMTALPKPVSAIARTVTQRVLGFLTGWLLFAILCAATYYGVGWVKSVVGASNSSWILAPLLVAGYIGLLYKAAKKPDLEPDDLNKKDVVLPDFREVYPTGLYYILPIMVLVWLLMIERFSPGLSAFWATVLMMFILLTQKPLKSFFRRENRGIAPLKEAFHDLLSGLSTGARNMIGIGVATAAAGIIVGTVTLTGIGQVMAEFVEFLSGGNLIVMLVMVGIISLILGMGLPTTANYIVVSSLMAGVVVQLGAASGLIVPLIAVHMFVFYFGIMADVTPPVGLASFAAAAVSGGDPIKTGLTAFFYSLRTIALPFFFIFNTDLLLIDVDFIHGVLVFCVALAAMLIFAAGTQGYFMTRNKLWESAALLLISFTLFRPGYWLDQMDPPYEIINAAQQSIGATDIQNYVETYPHNKDLRLVFSGPANSDGRPIATTLLLEGIADNDGTPASTQTRLAQAGLDFADSENNTIALFEPLPGTPYSRNFLRFDFYGDNTNVLLERIEVPKQRLPKELFYLPALGLLGLITVIQRKRHRKQTQVL